MSYAFNKSSSSVVLSQVESGPVTNDKNGNKGNPEPPQNTNKRDLAFGILAAVIAITLSVLTILFKDRLMNTSASIGASLLGMLVISFLAGSVLSFTAIPVPYWILVFSLPSVLAVQWGPLAPLIVGFTSALGATLGHLPTFLIGYGSSRISRRFFKGGSSSLYKRAMRNRYYVRVISWAQKHGGLAAFIMSAVFNPFHLPMTIAIGALHYPIAKFFLFSLLGNIVKSMILAFAGYFGINELLRILT